MTLAETRPFSSRFSAVSEAFLDPNGRKFGFLRPRNARKATPNGAPEGPSITLTHRRAAPATTSARARPVRAPKPRKTVKTPNLRPFWKWAYGRPT